jgi:hypothetical protein
MRIRGFILGRLITLATLIEPRHLQEMPGPSCMRTTRRASPEKETTDRELSAVFGHALTDLRALARLREPGSMDQRDAETLARRQAAHEADDGGLARSRICSTASTGAALSRVTYARAPP